MTDRPETDDSPFFCFSCVSSDVVIGLKLKNLRNKYSIFYGVLVPIGLARNSELLQWFISFLVLFQIKNERRRVPARSLDSSVLPWVMIAIRSSKNPNTREKKKFNDNIRTIEQRCQSSIFYVESKIDFPIRTILCEHLT